MRPVWQSAHWREAERDGAITVKTCREYLFRSRGEVDFELSPGTAMYKSGPRHHRNAPTLLHQRNLLCHEQDMSLFRSRSLLLVSWPTRLASASCASWMFSGRANSARIFDSRDTANSLNSSSFAQVSSGPSPSHSELNFEVRNQSGKPVPGIGWANDCLDYKPTKLAFETILKDYLLLRPGTSFVQQTSLAGLSNDLKPGTYHVKSS